MEYQYPVLKKNMFFLTEQFFFERRKEPSVGQRVHCLIYASSI